VYVKTLPVYLGAFGIVWVTGSIRRAISRLFEILNEIRPCFLVSDAHHVKFTKKWITKLANNKGSLSVALILIIIARLITYLSIFHKDLLDQFGILSLRPSSFPAEWYEGNALLNMLILNVFGVFCALPLGTGIWMLIVNMFFLNDLPKLHTVPLPGVILANFRGITNFYLLVAFTWFLGVGLIALVFFKESDFFAVISILALSIIGLITFFLPQYVFHEYLVRAYKEIAAYLNAIYNQAVGGKTLREIVPTSRDQNLPISFEMLTNIVQSNQPVRMWIYDLNDVLILIVGQLLALGSLAVKSRLIS
jgi:hypothetical protein